MPHNITIVMVKTRFPENIGMVARAGANMGAGQIVLVEPEWWDIEKARPLATSKGLPLLDNVQVVHSLAEAVKDCTVVIGTTARTGGWRQDIATPDAIAPDIAELLGHGEQVAIVLGPEDKGLNNEEIEHCTRLVTIPTAVEASSLNVAQAALIMLYEVHKAWRLKEEQSGVIEKDEALRCITQKESAILFDTLRATLLEIDYLKQDNTDYFLMPLRRFVGKHHVVRHEFDMLMGICRQVRRLAYLQKNK